MLIKIDGTVVAYCHTGKTSAEILKEQEVKPSVYPGMYSELIYNFTKYEWKSFQTQTSTSYTLSVRKTLQAQLEREFLQLRRLQPKGVKAQDCKYIKIAPWVKEDSRITGVKAVYTTYGAEKLMGSQLRTVRQQFKEAMQNRSKPERVLVKDLKLASLEKQGLIESGTEYVHPKQVLKYLSYVIATQPSELAMYTSKTLSDAELNKIRFAIRKGVKVTVYLIDEAGILEKQELFPVATGKHPLAHKLIYPNFCSSTCDTTMRLKMEELKVRYEATIHQKIEQQLSKVAHLAWGYKDEEPVDHWGKKPGQYESERAGRLVDLLDTKAAANMTGYALRLRTVFNSAQEQDFIQALEFFMDKPEFLEFGYAIHPVYGLPERLNPDTGNFYCDEDGNEEYYNETEVFVDFQNPDALKDL